MNRFANQRIVAWRALRLSQRRYSQGRLFIAGVYECERFSAVDTRYYVEKGTSLIPTRYGFRVELHELPEFTRCLEVLPRQMGERTVFERSGRSLRICYRSDSYGEGIHIRYFKATPKYTGWESRGVRFTVDDFEQLQLVFSELRITAEGAQVTDDLFRGRTIAQKDATQTGGEQYINEMILRVIDSL